MGMSAWGNADEASRPTSRVVRERSLLNKTTILMDTEATEAMQDKRQEGKDERADVRSRSGNA